jgi:hypothetical protein
MCPRTYYLSQGQTEWAPQGLGDLDFALAESLIKGGASQGLQSIKLNFLGEPLLYPRLVDLVALAAQAGLWVMLNTNAVALTENLGRELLLAGLTDIFFSFDSPYPQEYEAIRVGASYERVLSNIRAFMATKESLGLKAVQTRASLVLPEAALSRERLKADYTRLFRDLKVAEIGFGLPTVMGRDYSSLNPPTFTCPDLYRRVFVFQDGVYGPCCGDWARRIDLGSLQDGRSLQEVWLGQEYAQLRAAHQKGDFRAIAACRGCSVPYLSTVTM